MEYKGLKQHDCHNSLLDVSLLSMLWNNQLGTHMFISYTVEVFGCPKRIIPIESVMILTLSD